MYMEIFFNVVCYLFGMVTGSIITARYLTEQFDNDDDENRRGQK